MATVAGKIKELQEREAKIKEMGGAKAVEKLHSQGKNVGQGAPGLFL
jgi:methylmalonyl-CoA decarboxylase subunit alpha